MSQSLFKVSMKFNTVRTKIEWISPSSGFGSVLILSYQPDFHSIQAPAFTQITLKCCASASQSRLAIPPYKCCHLSRHNVKKEAFQVLLCNAMVCIPELMAFKMSKGNVAHREIKKTSLPFVGFHLKLFFAHSVAAVPTAAFLSLFLSPKAAGSSNANSSGCILHLLMVTLPCELQLAWQMLPYL